MVTNQSRGVRVRAELYTWYGHGEGGTVAQLQSTRSYGLYTSTPDEISQAERDAEYINACIQFCEIIGEAKPHA